MGDGGASINIRIGVSKRHICSKLTAAVAHLFVSGGANAYLGGDNRKQSKGDTPVNDEDKAESH